VLNIIGDGEHARVVREAVSHDLSGRGAHVAFVGKPGTTHRRECIEGLTGPFATIKHRSAIISPSAKIGDGCFIGANAVVNAGAIIGEHCVINTGAIVEHDCVLGKGVVMNPASCLGGGVVIGAWTRIGMGAKVRDHIQIGESVIVGMGAVVVKNVLSETTVMGVPAK